MIPRFTAYRAVCEHLEKIDRVTDASECCHQMVGELTEKTSVLDEEVGWVLGERSRVQYRYHYF